MYPRFPIFYKYAPLLVTLSKTILSSVQELLGVVPLRKLLLYTNTVSPCRLYPFDFEIYVEVKFPIRNIVFNKKLSPLAYESYDYRTIVKKALSLYEIGFYVGCNVTLQYLLPAIAF